MPDVPVVERRLIDEVCSGALQVSNLGVAHSNQPTIVSLNGGLSWVEGEWRSRGRGDLSLLFPRPQRHDFPIFWPRRFTSICMVAVKTTKARKIKTRHGEALLSMLRLGSASASEVGSRERRRDYSAIFVFRRSPEGRRNILIHFLLGRLVFDGAATQ